MTRRLGLVDLALLGEIRPRDAERIGDRLHSPPSRFEEPDGKNSS
jgi:hypothetical protein